MPLGRDLSNHEKKNGVANGTLSLILNFHLIVSVDGKLCHYVRSSN